MNQVHRIAVLVPLTVGVVVSIGAVLIHLLPLRATVDLIRREKRLGRIGTNPWMDMGVFLRVILYASLAHLVEVTLWAAVFIICGEFPDFGTAFYHSAVNYSSLGYGDVLMTPSWRLLGPVETANGMILFGITVAMIIAVLQRLIEARFTDLKD